MKPVIGVIGLGIMGGAMAKALIAAGFRVVGTDIRAKARADLKSALVGAVCRLARRSRAAPTL